MEHMKNEEIIASEEEPAVANGKVEFRLDRAVEYNGKTCETFTFDFEKLTGRDAENIETSFLPYGTRIAALAVWDHHQRNIASVSRDQTKEKSRSWEAYRLSGIAREMVEKSRMAGMFLSSRDPLYSRVEQIDVSDIGFLQTLCHRAGVSLKVSGGILVIFDQKEYEQKDTIIHIRRGDGTDSNYSISIGMKGTKYASCRVSYCNSATGEVIEATVYARGENADEEQLELTEKAERLPRQ